MGNYTFWAKFGAVRGLIGAAVGSVMVLTLYLMACPMIYQKLHQDMILSTGGTVQAVTQTALITAIPLALLILIMFIAAIVTSSIEYLIGDAVTDFFGVEASGVWKAMANGFAGDLVLMLFLLVVMSVATVPVVAGKVYVNPVALIFSTIPAGVICEIGYAAVTWYVMDKLGWL